MRATSKALRVAIVGYGIGGIAAAILLRRLGHDVVHFEQAERPGAAGAGLLIQPTGLAVLREFGLLEMALERGALVSRLVGTNQSGHTVMDLRYSDIGSGAYGLGIQRGALFQLLRAADGQFRNLRTSRIIGVDADGGHVFDNDGGQAGPFDLIVGADGAESQVRQALSAYVLRDREYAWGALLCMLEDCNGRFAGRVSQFFSGADHVSIWPVGSLEPGAACRINLSWRIPLRDNSAELTGDIEGLRGRIANLCPAAAPLLNQTPNIGHLLRVKYHDVQLTRYHRERVVLLGDAAHCMSPQLGQGASMALLDALTLARMVEQHENVPTALALFDRHRRAHMATYQRISRAVTPVFQSGNRMMIALRDCAFHPLSRIPIVRRSILRMLVGRPYGQRGATTGG